jgi:hypothetical protein
MGIGYRPSVRAEFACAKAQRIASWAHWQRRRLTAVLAESYPQSQADTRESHQRRCYSNSRLCHRASHQAVLHASKAWITIGRLLLRYGVHQTFVGAGSFGLDYGYKAWSDRDNAVAGIRNRSLATSAHHDLITWRHLCIFRDSGESFTFTDKNRTSSR